MTELQGVTIDLAW